MVRDYIEKIKDNIDVRKNLIALKAECKDYAGKHALLYALESKFQLFYDLLKAEDPKIRKNAALILGQLGVQESLAKLYEAYEQEKTLFVKSSYLTAMKELDYRAYLDELKERVKLLENSEPEEENKKHITEEIRILKEMILTMEGIKKHTFTGYDKISRIILLTNRNFREITLEQLKSHRAKLFPAGVMAKTDRLEEVLEVRTFSELLFVLEDKTVLQVPKGMKVDELAKNLAEQIAKSSFLAFLKERHAGETPFYFRVEVKSKMDLKQKSNFTKKLSTYLEAATAGTLQNSTSHYEVELRLIANKEGNFNFLIKLFTLQNPRFAYRKQALSTSIQPVNAALAMALAGKYLQEGAQVLDPFCGVGTMLVERAKYKEAGDMYGIDIFGKGIEAARKNTALADVRVNYINRDFFDFTHEYFFDELISNLPRAIGKKTKNEVTELYKKFWVKAKEHLKKGAIMVLYCYDRDILQSTLSTQWYQLLEEYEISKKEGAYCYVLRYEGEEPSLKQNV